MILSRITFRFRAKQHAILGKRSNYYVLLPEVPSDTPENNPLLRNSELPCFSQLNTKKCTNAIRKLIADYECGIHQIDQQLQDSKEARTVHNIILPLDRLSAPLDFASGVFKILYTVRKNDSIASAYIRYHPHILKAKRGQYLSKHLFKAFKELKENANQLTEPVRRVINKHLLESRLSGMDLTDTEFQHFNNILQKLEQHRDTYRLKLQESTSMFKHNLEFGDVRNFPRDLLRMIAADPSNPSKGPWTLTLDPYVYRSFLEYCDDRLLRWNAWHANNVRASASSGQNLNNSIDIEEIRYQRKELAQLLGYKSFADLSMQTKMAGNVENVMEMITTLHVKSKSATEKEISELQEFAKRHGFIDSIQLWDVPYLQRLHKEEIYSIDDHVVRQYFPLPTVLDGLFKLCHKLFNIKIKERTDQVDTWHGDVKCYDMCDEEDKKIASFYLDLYNRSEEKNFGSWMEIGRNRSDVLGSQPLAYLIFSFHPPAFGKPSLLSFEDLKTLMEKFGHLLQHSLTTVPYAEVAGLTNLEWDAVHICPLVMRSFLRHYPILAGLSGHVESGKTLPQDLHDRLHQRDNYMSGLRLTEEIHLSALDLAMYGEGKEFWGDISKSVWPRYMPFPLDKESARPCSFREIFSDQYPAAYFSRLWAEVIAADVFGAFEEGGFDDEMKMQQIALRFRDTFLSLGGGCHPGEVFRKFRGRDPSADALLVSLGLVSK